MSANATPLLPSVTIAEPDKDDAEYKKADAVLQKAKEEEAEAEKTLKTAALDKDAGLSRVM